MRDDPSLDDWFRREGVPHLARDFDPREDVLTRLRPALLVLFVVGLALVLRPDWPPWSRAAAAAGALLAAFAGLGLANRLRGRAWTAPPERVGFVEAGVFVVVPAVADLAVGDGPVRAAGVLAGGAVVAGVLYVLISLGVVSVLVHTGRSALSALRDIASIAGRALVLLLAVLLFLFLAAEVWQTLGTIEGWRFVSVLLLFCVLAVLTLVVGLSGERRGLYRPRVDDELRGRAIATPAAGLVASGVTPRVERMSGIQRANVAVALHVGLVARVAVVGFITAVFFVGFGLLTVDRPTTEAWTGRTGDALHVLAEYDGLRGSVVLSEPLLRVSTLLGAFAALYFAVVAVSEAQNRREFIEDELERVRGVVAAWAYDRGAAASDAAPPPG
ncbi:MAG: hypothetical protein IT200_03550 [Thermoleophilia bacterium]|nr:hypothetical protein [Thermoleophilia bacterium]